MSRRFPWRLTALPATNRFFRYWQMLRQINRLQQQFRYILDFYLVSDTQFGNGLVERANTVRTRRGDHPRTDPDGLFDPNLSQAFFSNVVLPCSTTAAATAEAPLPVVLHFKHGNTR